MFGIGELAFASPWLLAALATLPAIWWLLKVTPPAPQRIAFPAIRLLFGLTTPERTPAHMPWWLLLLRLVLAALVIPALAQPILNPGARLAGAGPVLIVVDDDWTAAPHWERRLESLRTLLTEAERRGRPVALVATAPAAEGGRIESSGFVAAGEARKIAEAMTPKPWPADRRQALAAVDALRIDQTVETLWLANGLDGEGADELAQRIGRLGPARVLTDSDFDLAMTLDAPRGDGADFRIRVRRAGDDARTVQVRATGEEGQLIAREAVTLEAGAREADLALRLPIEARNRIVRLEIENQRAAGSVFLLDERWRRRPVGLVSGSTPESAQPLLSGLYYLDRALDPFAEVRTGALSDLLDQALAVLIVADTGQIVGPAHTRLAEWVERGGVLVRFAGPKLAQNADELVPVRLRTGGRNIGGALSWATPARLAAFHEASPFYGLAVPGDVAVQRQVLAEPSLDLGDKTWARLADGTPLVTAQTRGRGRIVLFHVTADPEWSNLPLSGLFVEMLRRVVALSQGIAGEGTSEALPPIALLDGFGLLRAPPPTAQPLAAADLSRIVIGPRNPPGFYGHEDARRALNLAKDVGEMRPLGSLPLGVARGTYDRGDEVDLGPWLLLAAVVLLLVDTVASLWLRGFAPRSPARRLSGGAAGLLAAAGLAAALAAAAPPAVAQESAEQLALEATLQTRLAYVVTGIEEVDRVSRAGLAGLTELLARRTAVEAGAPLGVDLERDELAFFPLLYWAVDERQRNLSPAAQGRIDRFLKNGGTILFDTRDQGTVSPTVTFGSAAGVGSGTRRLRQLLAGLDLPALVVVPDQHVLTRAFYLLNDFPGRWAGGKVWVERSADGVNDGVSSVIVGSNDWAAAWATDAEGRPTAAVVPGGERQREMAFRFGVNVVMYALTGNYKADQVHVPAILERLGQ